MAKTSGRILVVDDDPGLRLLVHETCSLAGYTVAEAATGEAGLRQQAADPPDLILLDWELPDLAGPEVCRRFREHGFTGPIVMLTGRGADADVEESLRAGADDHLIKPISPRQLPPRIAAHLRRSPTDSRVSADRDAALRLAVLEQASVFFMQPPGALRRLASSAVRRPFKKGDVLLEAGRPNWRLAIIAAGRCEVSLNGAGGRLAVAMLGRHDVFGVRSIAEERPAAATVTAAEDGELIEIDRVLLEAAFERNRSQISQLRRIADQRSALLAGSADRTALPGKTASVTAVYSPKGGAGKTTIALNLAAKLAAGHPGSVAMLDLGLPFSDAALLGGLAPTTSLARLAGDGQLDEAGVLSAAVAHPEGFFLVTAALRPEEADLVTPVAVDAAMQALRENFTHVVVDCPVQLGDQTLSVLESAAHVLLVITPRLHALKDVPHLLNIFQQVLHLPVGRIHLVLNQVAERPAIERGDLERVAGLPVAVELGFDAAADEAGLLGRLVVSSAPRGRLARGIAAIGRIVS